ncbi:hypothetical protein MXL46_14080 [Heyndrickxia sporothermodurans]|uniref:MYM-type domain-containing protein n=1 Tax=Heyndrickxia sporothermodurans TaxID=46224 RepID=A0AB37HKF5_9BACI|nr:hypothetical protein [Heyndrickxia sporothermodurans]MBL5769229.1 hypothetical protein [Heyndrickxia sporothermodurans]MBL5772983.1 hypothetical protein [Heyndrickxia sporothermodurans]MBL5776460.1 hypothetical protein [Heyndrickxia sporothermodurans]MBL5779978.1 hypothetical protein [Heyndrickxia sporothermodurans]MBL5783571.1 hypothetical protein [Heyndrickxia sporothermodurans]
MNEREIRCGRCNKPITNKTEVEYSQEYSEFYCKWDCAVEAFFDRARCVPFDFKDKDVEIKRGKFYWK